MSQDTGPLLSLIGDADAELCGPDGCMIPAGHPAHTDTQDPAGPTEPQEQKDESMTRIAIITGSTRSNRVNPQVAQYIHEIARQRPDVEYEILDIADFDLPLYDEPVPAVMSSDYRTPQAHRWSQAVAGFDGYVFIVAEYNRGVTAALKNAIDYLYGEWVDKAAALVTYGSSGGTSAGRALREILSTLQVATVTQQPVFNLFTDFENMSVFAPSPVHHNSVAGMLDQVEKWSQALTGTRAAV